MKTTTNFQVERKNLFKTGFETTVIDELKDGEVLLEIEKYAFTTNNITYGVFGDRFSYWKFFPVAGEAGIIPAWGYAKVVESAHPEVQVGERAYGFLPMSNYLKVQVGKVSPFGFTDGSVHRKDLPAIYNHYQRVAKDIAWQPAIEDFIPVFRPLFGTSFLNYLYLKENKFYDSDNILLTSASSKTALGLAFLLKKNQAEDKKKIIGLTSAKNLDFVRNTGFYDEVLDYQNYHDKLPQTNSMLVDFSGNVDLLNRITGSMGDKMKKISLIGFTDWKSAGEVKIPIAEFFFAPTQAQKVNKELGVEEVSRRIAKGLNEFIESAKDWIELTYITKQDGLKELYSKMLNGNANPDKGYIVKLSS